MKQFPSAESATIPYTHCRWKRCAPRIHASNLSKPTRGRASAKAWPLPSLPFLPTILPKPRHPARNRIWLPSYLHDHPDGQDRGKDNPPVAFVSDTLPHPHYVHWYPNPITGSYAWPTRKVRLGVPHNQPSWIYGKGTNNQYRNLPSNRQRFRLPPNRPYK